MTYHTNYNNIKNTIKRLWAQISLLLFFEVVVNNFQSFPEVVLWWICTTTLYQESGNCHTDCFHGNDLGLLFFVFKSQQNSKIVTVTKIAKKKKKKKMFSNNTLTLCKETKTKKIDILFYWDYTNSCTCCTSKSWMVVFIPVSLEPEK